MDLVELEINLTGYHCNHWPFLKIYHNNVEVCSKEIVGQQLLTIQLSCPLKNELKLVHYGKQFGEDGVWDNSSTEECYININDIKFDQVSIGEHLKSQLEFNTLWSEFQLKNQSEEFIKQYTKINSNGMMSFNGDILLNFETPVYNWLTLSKYKIPMQETAYFSNYSARWHYDEDLKIINEIKELLNHV